MADNPEKPENSDGARGPSMMTKIQIIGGVVVLVLVECALAYMFIPSAQDVVRAAEMEARTKLESDEQTGEPEPLLPDEETVEISLGKPFGITAYRPLSESTMRIDFEIYATIRAEEQAEFEELLGKNENRFREQVIVIVRSSDESELTDPSLGLLKRKILEKTNHILGKPMVHSVVFSDYSFIDQ